MSIKVKNQHKDVVYVGELSISVSDRKRAVAALAKVLKKVETKELQLDSDETQALTDVQVALAALRPADKN